MTEGTCPRCGAFVAVGSASCTNCGQPFIQAPPPPPPPPPQWGPPQSQWGGPSGPWQPPQGWGPTGSPIVGHVTIEPGRPRRKGWVTALIVAGVTLALLVVIGVVIAIVIGASSSTSDASNISKLQGKWVQTKSPDGDYTMLLPEGMKPDVETAQLADGSTMPIHSLTLITDDEQNFGMASSEYDFTGRAQGISLLGAATGALRAMSGTLDAFNPTTTPNGGAASFTGPTRPIWDGVVGCS